MNSNLLATKLRSVVSALRDDLKPELHSAQAKLRAELIDMLLMRLSVEIELQEANDIHERHVSELLVAATGNSQATARAFSDELLFTNLSNEFTRQRVSKVVKSLAELERQWRSRVEAKLTEATRGTVGAKTSGGELVIDPLAFADYLRKRAPENTSITSVKLTTVPGGRSKATILADIEAPSGPRSIVLRKDFGISVAGASVAYEYPIIKAVWEAGLPVPQPLWLESDPEVIGGQFIAFSRVAGKAMGTLFTSDASPAFLREFAAVLARLHAVDIDATGLADKLNLGRDRHPVKTLVMQFRERYRITVPPTPLMDAAFAWLDLQLESIGNERALVHGDAALHNTMGDGDRMTALLDWELAHAGDPAEDLAYCKYLVERLMPWDDFMAAYYAAGGKRVCEARIRFFTIWRTLYLAVLTGGTQTLFESGGDQDLRIAGIGYTTFPRQLRDLATDLASYTAGE
ncbi:phosphotransferase family protein [Pseudomonas fluorescens]|nr:phosphotransferase family protein [Pseudomonas fluorescens]